MKILYVITVLSTGGVERQVLDLAGGMVEKGHTVELMVMQEARGEAGFDRSVFENSHRVTYLDIKPGLAGLWAGLRAGALTVNRVKPEIVHGHMYHASIFVRLLRLLVRIPCVVCTPHNTIERHGRLPLVYRVTDFLADMMTNVSKEATERFIEAGAVSRKKIVTIYNGINDSYYRRNEELRRTTRLALGLGSSFTFLAVGRLTEQKNYPNLLNAFSEFRESFPDSRLLIAGEGLLRMQCEAQCASLGLGASVSFLGIRTDVLALMNAADGFVLSSAWEGMPLVVVEAMLAELPVVATDCGGIRESIGECGVIVPAGDSRALAAGMTAVGGMKANERNELGAAARDRVGRMFSLRNKIDEWCDFYSNLLSKRN